MAFNKFKITDIQSKLNIEVRKEAWLRDTFAPFGEDAMLLRLLEEAGSVFLGSEKARSEFIITPVLQALRRKNEGRFAIFSGYEFTIDKKAALNGYCDFILSAKADSLTLEAPAFFVVETKKADVDDDAIAQCGAELYASQLFNERKGKPQEAVYGCVTSGYTWAFLRLQAMTLAIDPNFVPLTFKKPFPVLEVLQWILDMALPLQHSDSSALRRG